MRDGETTANGPLYLLDAIGPFFRDGPATRLNWSKIPFPHLERQGRVDRDRFARIRDDFARLCDQAARYGFNALSLDDLAHLADHPAYPRRLRERLADYREEYARLFAIAAERGLQVYLTTDLMFFNETLDRELGRDHARILAFLRHHLHELFTRHPGVAGLITRIGEADGLDVEGDFHSRLTIRSPRDARRYLRHLLPVFDQHRRRWIFRTWSVGAYRIGDLIWNRVTFRRTFEGITSPNLVVSMKYGESDFFRFLPLNRQFFRSRLPCLVELQARREYEGAGQFPAFIGADYERFRNQLREAPHLAGVMVWCQTGGWTRFRRLTFGADSSLWNEINTWVSVHLFRDQATAADAVESWRRTCAPHLDGPRLLRLLRLSEEVICELLYIDDFARQKVFFRRLRVPPLLSVFWDHVLVNHPMRQFLRCFVREGEEKILQGQRALEKIREMQRLAAELGLPDGDLTFMYDTFAVLAAARAYYFREFCPAIVDELTRLRDSYRARHPVRYSIHLDFRPVQLKRERLRWILKVLFRRQRGYRLVDRLFTIRLLGWLYPLLRGRARILPDFSRKQAMGIDAVFK